MNSLKKNFQNFKKRLDVPIHLFMILLARFGMNGILNLATPQLEIKKGIIRIDGKDDELTAQSFDKYSDAYDLLEELYGDLCCSDADYGDITYYDIVENNLKNINGE